MYKQRQPDQPSIVPKERRPAESADTGTSTTTAHPLRHAEFLTTAAEWMQLPTGGGPEVAIAGRSNAGKSSAINALAQHTRLAYVSKTPGRTQHINLFRLRSGALLADLPGYGYAKVPAEMRRYWQQFIARYLAERTELIGLLLVMDVRHPLTDLDCKLLDWFVPRGRPVHILLTKCDKLGTQAQSRTLDEVHAALEKAYGNRGAQISVQLFSATRRVGIADAETVLRQWLSPANPQQS